jgi:hypothetical protein
MPRCEGISVGTRGDAIRDVGSHHYGFHSYLENHIWDPYRKGEELFSTWPTNADYGGALERTSLQQA